MGTSCRLVAVFEPGSSPSAAVEALDAAESELRRVEALMSTWIDASEISQLNAAPAAVEMELSGDSLSVLRSAFEIFEASDGAFDVTARPLMMLWRDAGESGVIPSAAEITVARDASRRLHFELREGGAIKRMGSARVDLGGNAKGYGIDRALEAMRAAGATAGLVDVGGDLRVFGPGPGPDERDEGRDGNAAGLVPRGWIVDVTDPRQPGRILETHRIRDRAVCTSGNYARFTEIEGQRFSHIIDPRTGEPAVGVPSVTVLANTALVADSWATALSVLGPSGLTLLPDGVDALVLTEERGSLVRHATPGFPGAE